MRRGLAEFFRLSVLLRAPGKGADRWSGSTIARASGSQPTQDGAGAIAARRDGAGRAIRLGAAALAAAALTGCAQTHQRVASSGGVDPKYGVSASPRVVADGDEVPKGGGRYHVGKPYQIAGKTYYPSERAIVSVGAASWYGSDFHGRRTANGEVFDRMSLTAAHPTMPLPSYARVTNLRNSYSIVVRVNDRGPYHGGRVMDVSQRVAQALDFHRHGVARVRVEYIAKAGLSGSDDRKLLASLRTDGAPATLDGVGAPASTMVAETQPAEQDHSAPQRARYAARESANEVATEATKPARRRTAAVAPIAAEEERADETSAAEPTVAPRQERHAASARLAYAASAPLPPSRPLDLATIPGAAAPIAARR